MRKKFIKYIVVLFTIFTVFLQNSYALFPMVGMMKPYNPNNNSGSTIIQNKSIVSKEQEEIEKYKKSFLTKLSSNIQKLTDEKINNILEKVDILIEKYNNSKLSLDSKQKALYQLKALKIILQDELNSREELSENIDISGLFIDEKTTCKANEHIENNICVSNLKSCNISNGVGEQTFSGNSWGSCLLKTCDNGYENNDGSCKDLRKIFGNLVGDVKNNNLSIDKSNKINCKANEHIENNICVSNTKSCNISNGNGEQVWGGKTFGECIFKSCNAGFEKENGSCILVSQDNISDYQCIELKENIDKLQEVVDKDQVTYNAYDKEYKKHYYKIIAKVRGDLAQRGVDTSKIPEEQLVTLSGELFKKLFSDEAYKEIIRIKKEYSLVLEKNKKILNEVGEYYNEECNGGSSKIIDEKKSIEQTCNLDQHIENNSCVSNIKSCSISNGNGEQNWNGNSWENCIAKYCDSGYENNNGNCILKTIGDSYICEDGTSDIIIGNQTWMGCDMNSNDSGYCDGSAIISNEKCGVKKVNGENYYGKKYTWSQAMNGDYGEGSEGVCPDGYKVPTENDFNILIENGATGWNGNKMNGLIKSLPGQLYYTTFIDSGTTGFYWTANREVSGGYAKYKMMSSKSGYNTLVNFGSTHPDTGFSVRCIKK